MKVSDKTIRGADGLSFAVLMRADCHGMLQGHLADLLGMPYPSFSVIVAGLGVERHTLGRREAKVLKDQGLIHLNSRGGNFLPLASVAIILGKIQSESARAIETQIFSSGLAL